MPGGGDRAMQARLCVAAVVAVALLRDPGVAPLSALVVTAALGALLWPPRRPENGAP